MALQGDLHSFALPDVLRLLGGTGKTGRLAVAAERGSGELWVLDGDLLGGSVTSSPHASRPAELVFEVLRFGGGSFSFEKGEARIGGADRCSVSDAIEAAEALLAEWADVETVVPSVHATVSFVSEVGADEVSITSDQWKILAALGGGTTVRALAHRFEIIDLEASRRVKDLVEAGFVELTDPMVDHLRATTGERAEDQTADVVFDTGWEVSGEPAPQDLEIPSSEIRSEPVPQDLGILSSEDGPVVMESRDDALLPEPLPGAGGTFADVSQDERLVEHVAEAPHGAPTADVGSDPAGWDEEALAELATSDPDDDSADEEGSGEAPAEHDDRRSLMRFLSTVKP